MQNLLLVIKLFIVYFISLFKMFIYVNNSQYAFLMRNLGERSNQRGVIHRFDLINRLQSKLSPTDTTMHWHEPL